MNYFNTYFIDVFKYHYADFGGRATRSQFWFFALFSFIISFILWAVDGAVFARPVLAFIYWLAVLIPTVAIGVRRLHDSGKNGLLYALILIPFLGGLILLILFCLPGDTNKNAYGQPVYHKK